MKPLDLFYKCFFIGLCLLIGICVSRPGTGLYVKGRYLYDRCGQKVVLRGVDDMISWTGRDGHTFPEIAKTGANAVRMTCTGKDAATDLDKWCTTCYQNKMFPMPELHDATGNWAGLPALFTYWPLEWGWSDQKVKDTLQAGVNKNLAFIIGEFGNAWDQTAQGAIPYQALITQCQALDIGWLAWSWGPGNNPQT